ncbi:hypothetical protein NFI96_000723 [Prochilodus magdalenae]|nr:hypothetical protein NFI96_000723 [Prochilodus magdalenae]
MGHSFSPCDIQDNIAFCADQKLNQVPPLPKSIAYVDLKLNNISEINEKSFAGLKALQILIIQQQSTQLLLKNNAFSGLSSLRELDLGFNNLLQLEPGAFNGLLNLRTLNFTHCRLNDSILSDDYLKPLVSLERLSLNTNSISRVRPADFFFNMTKFHELDLSYNWINSICEEDLLAFQGKHFSLLKLKNIMLTDMDHYWPKWNQCGNPFKNMSMTVLDLSLNSFYVDMAVLFFKAIKGTKIHRLILSESSSMGSSVEYRNMKDPEKDTFKDLADSGVQSLDMSKCYIFALTYSVFGHMADLKEVIHSVPPTNNLQLLNLELTGIPNLWSQGKCLDVFDNLHRLQFLFLNNNDMQSLPENIFRGLTSLYYLDLSLNSLTYIPNGIFPKSLRFLDLGYNHLGFVDPHALSTLSAISLYGNRFLCDCSLRDLQAWLNETHNNTQIQGDVRDLTCHFPEEQHGVPLIYAVLCEDIDDEKVVENLRIVLFICCTVLILLIITGTVVFVRLRGYCFKLYRKLIIRFVEGSSPSPADDGFLYDVYLCFSPKDMGWVEKALLKTLDVQFAEQNDFRCCFEARDFLPGEDHLSNMRNAVWNSKKVLCVVSQEFLKDGWCLEAFTLAQSKMLEEVKDGLLVLLVENIPQYRLMKYEPIRTYVQTHNYLSWPEDSQDLQWFYSQLKLNLLKGTKMVFGTVALTKTSKIYVPVNGTFLRSHKH